MHPPTPHPALYRWDMDKTHIPVSVQVCEELNSDPITLMKSLLTERDRNKGKCVKGKEEERWRR